LYLLCYNTGVLLQVECRRRWLISVLYPPLILMTLLLPCDTSVILLYIYCIYYLIILVYYCRSSVVVAG